MRSKQKEFKYKNGEHIDIGELHAEIVSSYKNSDHDNKNYYKICCDRCKQITTKSESQLTKGSKCLVCINRIIVPGYNDIPTTDPWMIPYFQGGTKEASQYSKSSGKKIIPKCPFCGRIKNRPETVNSIYGHHGISCVCNDSVSFPNKFIYGLAEELLRIGAIRDFQREVPSIDVKGARRSFDIKLQLNSKLSYYIEMDGGYHGDVIKKHSKKRFFPAKSFYADYMKDLIAEETGIEIIRIDCYKSNFDYIKNSIMSSKLAQLFDLKEVCWDNVLKICCSNLAKTVCDYRAEHPNAFTSEASKIFHLCKQTVAKYWKMGAELGWCYYSPKEDKSRSSSRKHIRPKCCPIVIENMEDGTVKEIFSCRDFCDNAKEYIGKNVSRAQLERNFKKLGNPYIYKQFKITKLKNLKEAIENGLVKTISEQDYGRY